MTATVTRRATTLVEERALSGRLFGWVKERPVVVRTRPPTGRVVPAVSLPRLAARQRALEANAWHPTPRPGAGRAPTTAG